jgi:capsular exopolysaccharide synthesis family protein
MIPQDVLRTTRIPALFLINAGSVTPNPVELLGSAKMVDLIERLKESFDFVLVDTPPVLGVSDALVLGPLMDGVILVARAGKTPRKAIRQAQEKLESHKINGLGVIINRVQRRDLNYYYTDSYYKYYKGGQA